MNSAVLEWVDAETPHSKTLRHDPIPVSPYDSDIEAAVEQIERFQARLLRNVDERPLVVVDSGH
jgi:hypothetical protein